jgi:hypothetical protein
VGRAKFKEADATRLWKAATKAGLIVMVEVAPDGTMRAVPIKATDNAAGNPWDEVLNAKDTLARRPKVS